jgi:hypothetical protein
MDEVRIRGVGDETRDQRKYERRADRNHGRRPAEAERFHVAMTDGHVRRHTKRHQAETADEQNVQGSASDATVIVINAVANKTISSGATGDVCVRRGNAVSRKPTPGQFLILRSS